MEHEHDDESPHAIFMVEVVLDKILSFLGQSQLEARLVCKMWNQSILKQFNKKQALCYRIEDGREIAIPAGLCFNPKLLSSLKIIATGHYFSKATLDAMTNRLDTVAGMIQENHVMEQFRSLVVEKVLPKCLEHIFTLANTGLFQKLTELRLEVLVPSSNGFETSVNQVLLSNTFPKLTKFEIRVLGCYFVGRQLQSALQGLVSAAENLVQLTVFHPPDLKLSNLNKLRKLIVGCAREEIAINMMTSASRTLTILELNDCKLDILASIPELPKLARLKFCPVIEIHSETIGPNWGNLPCLSQLTISCDHDLELVRFLNSSTPLPQTLREFRLHNFPIYCEENETWLYNFVVNCPVPLTVVKYTRAMRISTVFEIIGMPVTTVYAQQHNQTRPWSLEFHSCSDDTSPAEPLQPNIALDVVNKLQQKWDRVRFVNFKIQQPAAEFWNFHENPAIQNLFT